MVAALMASLALALSTPAASVAETVLAEPPPVFEFGGSHGYRGFGFVGTSKDRSETRIALFVAGRGGSVIYSAPAVYEQPGAFRAKLGRLGSLDLHFVPDGGTAHVVSHCSHSGIAYPSGAFEGRFHFHGEEGYTGANLRTVAPSPGFLFAVLCPGPSFGSARPGPGAELRAAHRTHGSLVTVEMRKKGPQRPTYFTATLEERRGPIAISRTVGAPGPSRDLEYSRRGQAATASPPPPFSGTARLAKTGKRVRLLGGLEVDFPGRSNVPVAGPAFTASLQHVKLDGPIAHSGSAPADGAAGIEAGPVACPATLGAPWTRPFRSSALC